MPKFPRRIVLGIVLLVAAILLGVGLAAANRYATTLIAGEGFRVILDQETSKGLHLKAHYGPLQREGWLGLRTDSFHGDKGERTIVSLDAREITGWFNPLGISLRRWQVDDIHIKSGTVMLQKTEPMPNEPKDSSPVSWWAIFWPNRVCLEDVKVDDANVLFQIRKKESGLYHAFLEITPNGRDFEYDAHGGTFKMPMTPALNLEHAHFLIRKPRLHCPEFLLGDDPAHPEERMRVHGDAGLQEDRSMHVRAKIESLQVSPWLPENMRPHILGHMNGAFEYHSTGTGLETAQANGSLAVADAVLHDLPIVREYIKLTASPDPGDLHLQVCQTDLRWDRGALTAQNFKMECAGVFKIEGTMTMAKDKTLSGELRVGFTQPYLRWLPTAHTAIFTESDGPYFSTTVHLSGNIEKPKQDLSARVIKELEKSPLTDLKLFWRAL